MVEMKCKTCKSNCVWVGKEMAEHGKCLVGYTPKTNADKIRAMTDEELAETLCSGICNYCNSHENGCEVLAWLKKEVDDG